MGYYYEIAYIITNTLYIFTVLKLFNLFFEEKNCNKIMRTTLFMAYFFAISIIIFITRIPIIVFILNSCFLFLVSLSYKCSFQKKFLSISFIYAIGIIIEILSSVLFGFIELSGLKNSTFNSISVLIFTRVITLVIAYIISRYKSILKKEYTLPKVYFVAFFIVLLGTMYLFLFQLENESITIEHIIISGFILIAVNITMIILDERMYKAIIIEHEQILLKQHNKALENQMEIINQSTEAIRLLKHDFKDHLIMLSNLYKNGMENEIQPYIEAILGNIENESFANSSNFIIDSIINFKLRKINKPDVKLSISINVPISINIIAHDLTAILGNLIDNAITACEQSKDKILNIKISSNMGNLVILINNSYNGKLINENGTFKTTKLYQADHGLGLTSVKRVLEKYDGEIKIDYTSNMFNVSVVIPY